MLIAIPSRDRYQRIRDLYIVRYSSHKILDEAFWFVPTEQRDKYVRALDGIVNANQIVGTPVDGIAKTRRFIGGFARDEREKKFVMLDDDIRFYVRRLPSVTNLIDAGPEEVDRAMEAIDEKLDAYAHVSLSAREGNNRTGPGFKNNLDVENTRTLRCLAYQTDEFLDVEHGRVPVMEDFDVNLQLLRKGLKNCCMYWWAQGQRQTSSPGGCSVYRNHAVQEQAANRLAELHHPFVRTRLKENKTGGEFGTRTEVTIYWKKAYESSQ